MTERREACPKCNHGANDKALSVNVETGVFFCHRCGDRGKVGGAKRTPLRPRVVWFDDTAIRQRSRERIDRTWNEAYAWDDIKARTGRRYLASRGLGAINAKAPNTLRYHPALAYWDGTRSLGKYPAMLARLDDALGQLVTVHATYLRYDGCAKASVPCAKKVLGVPRPGATKGTAIRLYRPERGLLGVAEGIETALSLGILMDIPVWASYCADNLSRMWLPPGIKKLYIAIDLDASGKGEAVARELAKRVLSCIGKKPEVILVRPAGVGVNDLNDEVRARNS